jgi:hypothetical protein
MTEDFARAQRRIDKMMLVLAAAGLILATAWRGWTWGVGFALGAVVSWLNFRWLKQLVDTLAETATAHPQTPPPTPAPTRKRLAILAGLRYALLGGGAYAILRFTSVSLTAALIGLFVAVAAVIIEICIELVYARS